ncbi:hypothetical protein [Microvirga aerophila]|uniref:Uncharacterized protein n=1 Tax=Microvirga aerophila TaxID=670291 RepID=A0A512C1R8_9HYPH|nr:hypothetical protein [Microvirga aerophila]GEO18151.1 hypothetical protein MAE02_58470 [Microvirga aerophila]
MPFHGVFGVSIQWSGNDRPYQNMLDLDFDDDMRVWLPTAMRQAREAAEQLQEEPSLPLADISITFLLHTLLSRYCVNAIKAGDSYTASGYAHALVKHHDAAHGILFYDENGGSHFDRIEATGHDDAVTKIKRRLPYLTASKA